VKAWQSSSLEDWFYESHVIADSIYDATPDGSRLSYKYNFQFQDVLNQQLLKGGIRLAALLNEALE
ncbi:MAG: S1/P1 nuclease, partial [Chitinophagaceae bacterium]